MNTKNDHEIFFQSENDNAGREEPSFLDLTDFFESHIHPPFTFQLLEDSPSYPHPEHFVTSPAPLKEDTSLGEMEVESSIARKTTFKSSYNKNVCYNICQKTVKVIKKGLYEEKVQELCSHFEIDVEQFKKEVIGRKNEFTGPKALAAFLDEESQESFVLSAFMKWFLSEKYLRLALTEGEMKDVKAYIEYKNQVILPLLG